METVIITVKRELDTDDTEQFDKIVFARRYKADIGLELMWQDQTDYTPGKNDIVENTICLNYISTVFRNKMPHPKNYALKLNEKFKAYDLEKGKFYGVNLFDFADSQLADKIIQSN